MFSSLNKRRTIHCICNSLVNQDKRSFDGAIIIGIDEVSASKTLSCLHAFNKSGQVRSSDIALDFIALKTLNNVINCATHRETASLCDCTIVPYCVGGQEQLWECATWERNGSREREREREREFISLCIFLLHCFFHFLMLRKNVQGYRFQQNLDLR